MAASGIRLGSVGDFPEGEGVRVDLEEFPVPIAVFNLGEEFYAVPDSCPHKGGPFSRCGTSPRTEGVGGTRGKLDPEELTVSCPWHGLEFDLESGECPATDDRLRSFDVTVEGEDVTLRL